MNKKQIEVQKAFLNDEEVVLASLEKTYNQSLKEINKKSKELQKQIEKLQMGLLNGAMSDEEKEKMQSMIRSKVYQKKYQDSLKKQVSGILDDMHKKSYKTIASYLDGCYEQGFLGAMYDMQGQGVPLFFPMDQEAMVKAVQIDSKISKGLYSSIGEDVANLKKTITATVSRGIATGSTYSQIAQQIKGKMVGVYNNVGGALYRAETIARTEGHRIQVQSAMDACTKAKSKGADVLKQWDSTMDSATRESHVAVDGEIRELDEKFSNGLMFPGDPSGGAGEVVNCRCALLQRARWALDEDELEALKEKAAYYGVDKAENFEDFKKKYLKATKDIEKNGNYSKIVFEPATTLKEATQRMSDALGVETVSLGRMPIKLANQYLEGVERFMQDFPMLKGYYNQVGTRTGAPSTMGLNKLAGEYIDNRTKIKLTCELHLKSTNDYNKILESYAHDVKVGGSYKNESPLSTAIHELVHGIDHAITFKKYGAFNGNGLGVIDSKDWNSAKAGVSQSIIRQVRQEMFGAQFGKEVAEKTRYLGSYARTSSKEELAEAISYEYVSESNPYSARILELFKEQVERAFGK